MGLTEARSTASRPDAADPPGTIAGTFDPAAHVPPFRFRSILRIIAPSARNWPPSIPGSAIITVSPVLLTATASDQHVLVATTYSKSVLRAVAGQLYAGLQDLDYFLLRDHQRPIPSRGFFFESNLRSVSPAGVETVMRTFFDEHAPDRKGRGQSGAAKPRAETGGTMWSGGRSCSRHSPDDPILLWRTNRSQSPATGLSGNQSKASFETPVTRPCFRQFASPASSSPPTGIRRWSRTERLWFAGSPPARRMQVGGSRLVPRGQRLKAQMTAVSGGPSRSIPRPMTSSSLSASVSNIARSSLLRTYRLFSDMVRAAVPTGC